MRHNLRLLLLLAWHAFGYAISTTDLQELAFALYVPFDISANVAAYPHYKQLAGQHLFAAFKQTYERHNFLNITINARPKIPKIIHQIWLGGPLPEKYQALQKTWQDMHPTWEYRLWTDKDIKEFGLINQDLFDEAPNYGEKSDIARYEILYRLGGLYIDTDFSCLQPFDIFHHAYDFYTSMQPLDGGYIHLVNGLIGSVPGHPILKYCIEQLRHTKHITQTIIKTGPIFFTQAVIRCLYQGDYINGIFPPSYFYPLGFSYKKGMEIKVRPESFAIHYWDFSWAEPEALQKAQLK